MPFLTIDDGELLRAIFFLGCYVGATRQKLSRILKWGVLDAELS